MKKITCFLLFSFALFAEDLSYEVVEDQAKVEILNPDLATRKTAKIRLKNGLEAFLVSDPQVPQSGAALAVKAGSWEDPEAYPGTAHFLEHMLFMGNAAFPKEFEYMWFINDHGGMNNAFTAPDRTVYIFSVNNDAFTGAMERFSHFFIDPLFLPSCIGRELHAVDQEHGKNIENDLWREHMILKETGNPDHPNAGFSTGNAKTLGGIPQAALKKWYSEQYSANRMHLFAVSPLPIEEMTNLAVKEFSAVPVHPIAERGYPSDLFSEQQKGHILYIKPIKDLKTISLNWQVPTEYATDQERKALELVAYALGHEAENGLSQQLKKEKLAEAVFATIDRESKEHAIFRVIIALTDQGIAQIPTAIDRTFQAISKLKEQGIPRYIFDELQTMALVHYQYQSREQVFSYVSHSATALVDEPLETFPEKTLIPTTYDPTFVKGFIQTLTPQSSVFVVTADPALTSVETDSKEKWMEAEYTLQPIESKQLLAWANEKSHPQIDLPPQNPFIPKSLAVLSAPDETPALIANDNSSKVYYIADKQYQVPLTVATFNVQSPLIDGSAKQMALLDLYLRSLDEKLTTTQFFGNSAGLGFSSSVRNLKVVFAITGYSDKAPLFTKTIVSALKNVTPSQDQFEIYKRSLLSDYDNSSKELPVFQAMNDLSNILFNDAPLPDEKAKALKTVSYQDFCTFSKSLLDQAFVSSLFYGNLTSEDAAKLWNECKKTLAYTPYLPENQVKKTLLLLPEKQGPFLISKTTPRQGNGIVLVLEEGPFSFESKAAQQILSKALREGFFDTLRTKQQTAYMAKAWDGEAEKQLLQFFAVQSITHQPLDLLARFDLFLEDLLHNFHERLSPERFETIRQNIIQTLKMTPENISMMASRLNSLAFDYDGDFQWIDKQIDGLKAISYDNVVQYAHKQLSRNNSRRIAVLMEGVLTPENNFRYETVSREDITEAGKFVSSR